MLERKNKIWGVIIDGEYQDYKSALTSWTDDESVKIINSLRNQEADEDVKGKHLLLCPYCEKPVCIRYQKSIEYPYIKHKFPSDSHKCIIEDSSKNNECQNIIRARKYEGRKTGQLHKKVLSKITEIIEITNGYKLLKEPEGKRLYHISKNGEYRIPDVYFSYRDKKYVIEVQNSPEWLKVIAERNKFYKENNIVLLWVFTKNSLINNSVSSIDIASRQKFNFFSFNEKCYKKSISNKELNFMCSYDNPVYKYTNNNYETNVSKVEEMITLSDLSYGEDAMPYYVDSDYLYMKVEEECSLRNMFIHEFNVDYHQNFNNMYYQYMLESAFFAKFKCFPENIKDKPIVRLNHIAHCYISVIYLYMLLKKYNTYDFALSYDKKGTLKRKFDTGLEFWNAVKKKDDKAVTMLSLNQRTTPYTITKWKETIKSERNNSTAILPYFEQLNKKVLNAIESLEINVLPYV